MQILNKQLAQVPAANETMRRDHLYAQSLVRVFLHIGDCTLDQIISDDESLASCAMLETLGLRISVAKIKCMNPRIAISLAGV